MRCGSGSKFPYTLLTMSLLHYIRRLYSLDTLDTRFVCSSSSPPNAQGVVEPSAKAKRELSPTAQPSRWNTLEYYFYYVVFITIIPLMFYVPYTVSRGRMVSTSSNILELISRQNLTLSIQNLLHFYRTAGYLGVKWYDLIDAWTTEHTHADPYRTTQTNSMPVSETTFRPWELS